MKPKNHRKGQTLLEVVIVLIILPLFISAIIRLAQVAIVRQRLLIAARHGVWLTSSERVKDSTVKKEILDFLSGGTPSLEKSRISVKIDKNEGTYRFDTVTVDYSIEVLQFSNNFFKPVGKETVKLSEKAVVANVSWSGTKPYGL